MSAPVVTQADVYAAALQWCGEKDRETSLDDIRYFQNNWQALPGFRSRVNAFARHRTAAESASAATVAELVEALEGLIEWVKSDTMPPDAPERLRLAFAAIDSAKATEQGEG